MGREDEKEREAQDLQISYYLILLLYNKQF